MLWLYILLGIVAFITAILILPIKLKAEYNGDFECKLIIGFVPVRLYPEKPKKKKSKKESKNDKKEQEPERKNLLKENGIGWLTDLIINVAKLAVGVLKDFFSHIIITKLDIRIKIAGEDAADTAIKYGGLCSVVYPAIGTVAGTVKCRTYGVEILPDFSDKPQSEAYLFLFAKVRVFHLLGLVFRHGITAIKLLSKINQNKTGE